MLDKDGKAILNPIEAMRQSNNLNLLEESDALKLPDSGFLDKAKAKVMERGMADKEKEKQRIKEKRLKKKR